MSGIIGYVLGAVVFGGFIGFVATLSTAMDYKIEFKKSPSWQLSWNAFKHYRNCAIILPVVVAIILFVASLIRSFIKGY